MKNYVVGVIIALVFAVIAAVYWTNENGSGTLSRKVVVVLPMTGGAASWGEEFQRGVTMFNEEYSDGSLEVVVVDSQTDPAKAVSAVQQAYLGQEPYALVSTLSTITAPIVEWASQEQRFVVCCMTSDSILKHPDFVQRIYPSAMENAAPPANYAKGNYPTIGVLYSKGEFGESVNRIFSESYKSDSTEIVVSEVYDGNDATTVRSLVAKVMAAKPEAVFVTGIGSAYWSIFSELRTMGYAGAIISDASFGDIQQIEKLKEAGEGVVFMAGETELTSPRTMEAKEFNDKFEKRFNEPVNYTGITVFESLRILQELAKIDSKADAAAFRKLGEWQSVAGPIRLLKTGECDYPWILVEHREGKIVPLEGK